MRWSLSASTPPRWLAQLRPAPPPAWASPRRALHAPAHPIDSRVHLNAPHGVTLHGAHACARAPTLPPALPRHAHAHAHVRPFAQHTRTCFTLARMSSAVSAPTQPAEKYRLPTNVRPTHYDLTVRTDLKGLKFDGYVTAQCVFRSCALDGAR